jgi:hypothetical protein
LTPFPEHQRRPTGTIQRVNAQSGFLRFGWLESLRSRLANREVAPGWTVLFVPLLIALLGAFGSYSGRLLPWLGRGGVLHWAGVAALAVGGFAAAYALTEAGAPMVENDRRRPVLRQLGGPRVLGLALVFVCVSFVKGLATFAPDAQSAKLGVMATWWSIPVALCFWTLAAMTIARETEQAGIGRPAAPGRTWPWLRVLRESWTIRIVVYLALFGGTVAFAVIGTIPGLIWGTSETQSAWRGYVSEPLSAWYVSFFAWAGALVVAAWLYLLQAFRARPSGLSYAEVRRAWYAVWTSGALVLLMGLFVLAGLGVLSEQILDLVLALYALFFVLMIVDASATARHRKVKSSLRRRIVAALCTIALAFALATILDTSLIRTGVLAACLAAVIPLVPMALRALYGIERIPAQRRSEVSPTLDPDQLVVEPLLWPKRSRCCGMPVGRRSSSRAGNGSGFRVSTCTRSPRWRRPKRRSCSSPGLGRSVPLLVTRSRSLSCARGSTTCHSRSSSRPRVWVCSRRQRSCPVSAGASTG